MHQPHDALAKNFLGNLVVARDFLTAHLPEAIRQRCELETLKIEPVSFIEPDLRQHFSDIKHVKDRDILNLAHDITELLQNYQISRELYQHMLQYIVNCGESQDYQTFLKVIIDHSTAKYQEDTMTIAEQLRREGYSKGIHVGIEQGIQKGKAEGEYTAKLNVARNMLINHFDYDTIKEMTGLSSLDLSKIINNH